MKNVNKVVQFYNQLALVSTRYIIDKLYQAVICIIMIDELKKPFRSIDWQHQFRLSEIDPIKVIEPLKVTEEELIAEAQKRAITQQEIMLGRIESARFLQLKNYVGLWWIALNPVKTS